MSYLRLEHMRTQFGEFDDATWNLIIEAARADLKDWSERLIAAWASGNDKRQREAWHSLKGLCENFGASALLDICGQDLSTLDAQERLRSCLGATLEALSAAIRQSTAA